MARLALLVLLAAAALQASEGVVTPIIPRSVPREDGTAQGGGAHALPAVSVAPPITPPPPAEAPHAPYEATLVARHAVTRLAVAALAHPALRPLGLGLIVAAHASR